MHRMHGGSRSRVVVRRWARPIATVAMLSCLGLVLVAAVPASASPDDRQGRRNAFGLTRLEARRYGRWWDGQASVALPDMPLGALGDAAEQAWAAGTDRRQIAAALFSDAARNLLAPNAAGGEGRPSPYLAYFENNPGQLAGLGAFLTENPTYVGGPGGTQELLFGRFPGLRESYLASLGLAEVDGRIVDPRAPFLTPYLASVLLGDPRPLPQPDVALNLATA